MTLLDLCFKIDRRKDLSDSTLYDYWLVDNEGIFLFMSYRNEVDFFIDVDKINTCVIDDQMSCIYNDSWMVWTDEPNFIPYEELEPYFNIEIKFESLVEFEFGQKYPLVCVRGICDKQCSEKKLDGYCFHELPCTNNRPDYNAWSCKYPNFYDLIFDVAEFAMICPHIDSLVVMFEYTPYIYDKELSFDYCTGLLVRDNKIMVLDKIKTKSLYQEYNKKYPTEDRQIEKSISEPEKDFYFKF